MRLSVATTVMLVALSASLAGNARADEAGGVGIAFRQRDDKIFVVEKVFPGGPADRAGVKPGDVLMRVDDEYAYSPKFGDPRTHIGGKPGTSVKLSMERGADQVEFTIERVPASSLGGGPPSKPQQPPVPADEPKPQPDRPAPPAGPGPADKPGPGDKPGAADRPGRIAMAVGLRLTYQSGDSTLAGSHLVPDDQGWIKDKRGQRFRIERSRQGGGVGFCQLNVLRADGRATVADVRNYLITNIETGVSAFGENSAVAGDGSSLGSFWVSPQRLAAMRPGEPDESTSISRGPYSVGGRTFPDAVSIRHSGRDGYSSRTYDSETGILLFEGSTDADPSVFLDNNGQTTELNGNKSFHHAMFVGARMTTIPWMNAAAPDWTKQVKRLDYQGSARSVNIGGPGSPVAISFGLDQVDGGVAISHITLASSNGPGLPATERTSPRAYGSAQVMGLWVDPATIARLRPNQTLDADPITHYATIFAGTQGRIAMVVERGATDSLEQSYDTQTGMLVGIRLVQNAGPMGAAVTELQLAGQR